MITFSSPSEFAFSVGYGSIVPRGRQRPQNRRLKHQYKQIESRVRIISLLGSFAVHEAFLDSYATILSFPVDFRRLVIQGTDFHRPMSVNGIRRYTFGWRAFCARCYSPAAYYLLPTSFSSAR